ncbi:MAG: hypothetical protein K2P80_15210 [Beijerinckiaceae bacterium]|nr:hypothetical protein [Beijerinckiaceae bacterium]
MNTRARCVLLRLCLAGALIAIAAAKPSSAQTPQAARPYLTDAALFESLWWTLTERIGKTAKVLRIDIEPERIAVVAENPIGLGRMDEWTMQRTRLLRLFNSDMVAGPRPIETPRVVDDVRSGLFLLSDIAMSEIEQVKARAIERARLDEQGSVRRISIERSVNVFAQPRRYGALFWRITVGSDRESATIYAEPGGRIFGADLSQTNRAARLDLLTQTDWPMDEAKQLIKTAIGEARLTKLEVGRKQINGEYEDPARPNIRQTFSWDLSGLRPGLITRPTFERAPVAGFTIDDVDLNRLQAIRAAALAALAEPSAQIIEMVAEVPGDSIGLPALEWRVVTTFANTPPSQFGSILPNLDERGIVKVRLDGTVRSILLPKSRRKPINWFAPASIVIVADEIRKALGPDIRIAEINIGRDGATIRTEDPLGPGSLAEFKLDSEGLKRRTGPMGEKLAATFTFSALTPGGVAGLPDIVTEAINRIDLPSEPMFSIRLYASAGYRTPKGSPMLEVWRNGARSGIMTYRFATGEYTTVRW